MKEWGSLRAASILRHPSSSYSEYKNNDDDRATKSLSSTRRQLNLDDAINDNYWSTSLYSQPPVLTSARCVHALRDFFANPSLLAVATESSSHPTGLQSVLAQPWLYAGGGLGNIPECPLQVCIAGAGTRRDSITFASVCVPYECHALDLAANDFPASLVLAAQDILYQENNPTDDDDPLEYFNHPERHPPADDNDEKHKNHLDSTNSKKWWHSSPGQQAEFAEEYITLHTRINKINNFLNTGWICGNYQVPFQAFPFGVPYLVLCAILVLFTILGTYRGNKQSNTQQPERMAQQQRIVIETDVRTSNQEGGGDETRAHLLLPPPDRVFSSNKLLSSSETKSLSATLPTRETPSSSASLSSESSDQSSSPRTLVNAASGQEASSVVKNLSFAMESSPSVRKILAATSAIPEPTAETSTTSSQPWYSTMGHVLSAWNANKHWDTLCTSRHEATACLDGLRVWSILWVILGHVMAIQSSTGGGYSNPVDFLPPSGITTTWMGQLIFASRFAVDTFLVISGYLLVIVMARKAPTFLGQRQQQTYGKKLLIFFQLIGLRLIRILPLYLFCLGFYTQIAPHMYLVGEDNEGGGPFWFQWDSLLQPCRDYGWTNLLFINNFLPWGTSNTEQCMYWSWYLSVDMQLFVLFGLPVTYFIFLKNPIAGRRTTMALWIASMLMTAFLAYYRHWSVNTFDGLAVALFDVEGYAKPHVRGQAYFAGMYVAMLQLTKPARSANRTWKHRALLWGSIFALGCVTFCTVTGAYARRPCQYTEWPIKDDCGSLWSPTATFLYTASSRAIWSCSIAILMILCLDGNGGWLNQFLSWPIWAPLAQLSFGTYLIHPIVIFVWLLGMRQKNAYSLATFGMSLTSVSFVSFMAALVAALIVEFPVATLISRLLKRKSSSPRTRRHSISNSYEESARFITMPSNEEKTELIRREGAKSSYGTT